MDKQINQLINEWKFIRGLNLDILAQLNDEQLHLTVGKNVGTLGEQFRHLVRVEFQYLDAIKTKTIQETKGIKDFEKLSGSKDKLMKLLNKLDEELIKTLQSIKESKLTNYTIDWSYWHSKPMTIYNHLTAMISHETLHQGQIIIYMRAHNLKFPRSWKAWGL